MAFNFMAQRVLKQGNPKFYTPRVREGKIRQGQVPMDTSVGCPATLTMENSDLVRMETSVHLHNTSQLQGTLTLISSLQPPALRASSLSPHLQRRRPRLSEGLRYL